LRVCLLARGKHIWVMANSINKLTERPFAQLANTFKNYSLVFAPTNLVLHDPTADNLQRALVFPLGFPLYDHRASREALCVSAIEFLFDARNILPILMQPLVRSLDLFVLVRAILGRVLHGGFVSNGAWGRKSECNWGQLRANGSQWSVFDLYLNSACSLVD
jgi:hypothetical protein